MYYHLFWLVTCRSLFSTSILSVCGLFVLYFYWYYSASSLERPLLWFMVNDYVLCHQIVTITVNSMKSGLDVPLSFFSMLRSFEVFEISDNKVIGA